MKEINLPADFPNRGEIAGNDKTEATAMS